MPNEMCDEITYPFSNFNFAPLKFIMDGLVHAGINSSPPGQNGHHFADDDFSCILVNEKFCTLIKISLKFVPKGPIDNSIAFV